MTVRADTAGGELAADTLPSITGLTPQDFGAATVDGLDTPTRRKRWGSSSAGAQQ